MRNYKLKGIIFDLDGTLVESKLDFDLMREEMRAPQGVPIIEYIEGFSCLDTKKQLWEVVERHEWEGALRSEPFLGVEDFLEFAQEKELKLGLLTRNSRRVAEYVVEKCNFPFSAISTRDDVNNPKPDPEGLLKMAKNWNVEPGTLIYVGDYAHDYEAGLAAGMKTLGYNREGDQTEADYTFQNYNQLQEKFENILYKLGF